MTRLVGHGQTAPGSVEFVHLLDLRDIDLEQRPAAIDQLLDELEPGSTVEIIIAEIGDGAADVVRHLHELVDGGIHLKLCGASAARSEWIAAIRNLLPAAHSTGA